jgi:hypothetical protein
MGDTAVVYGLSTMDCSPFAPILKPRTRSGQADQSETAPISIRHLKRTALHGMGTMQGGTGVGKGPMGSDDYGLAGIAHLALTETVHSCYLDQEGLTGAHARVEDAAGLGDCGHRFKIGIGGVGQSG